MGWRAIRSFAKLFFLLRHHNNFFHGDVQKILTNGTMPKRLNFLVILLFEIPAAEVGEEPKSLVPPTVARYPCLGTPVESSPQRCVRSRFEDCMSLECSSRAYRPRRPRKKWIQDQNAGESPLKGKDISRPMIQDQRLRSGHSMLLGEFSTHSQARIPLRH